MPVSNLGWLRGWGEGRGRRTEGREGRGRQWGAEGEWPLTKEERRREGKST